MKRINIILISLLTIALASCGKQDNPKQAVRTYYNALQHEEFYEAAQVCLTANPTRSTIRAIPDSELIFALSSTKY